MNGFFGNFYKDPVRILLALSVILMFIVVASFVFFLIFPTRKNPFSQPVIQYSPAPTTYIQPIVLTSEEKKYPEASPQRFFSDNKNQSGILILTSDPAGARVIIDSEDTETSSTQTLPVDITPFKVSAIPTGQHNLTLFKKGYNMSTTKFSIEPNKITRLNVALIPQEQNIGY